MKITANKRQKYLIFSILFILLAAITFSVVWNNKNKEEYVTSYSTFDYIYQCSKPIKVRNANFPKGGEGPSKGKFPVDPLEASKYCHVSGVY